MNYRELQELYQEFKSRGFTVLAFPCNQFGKQEPGTNAEIKEFSRDRGAEFPMFAKIKVNGPNADPLWKFLKASVKNAFGQGIKWNFAKFLVDRNGYPISRHATSTSPSSLRKNIEALLDA